MDEQRLHSARLLGSFIAYYTAGKEYYAEWFNGLPMADQQLIFDMMIEKRRGELAGRYAERKQVIQEQRNLLTIR